MSAQKRKDVTRRVLAWVIVLVASAGTVNAQPVDVPPTWGGDFWDRPRLTGSWFGLRDDLGKKGVVLDLDLLQLPQGVVTGGREETAAYGGLAEYTLNVDTQKLGLWPGGFLNVMAMTGFGQNVNRASGAVVTTDFIGILPQPGAENTTGLMSLAYAQFLSNSFGLIAGKLYTLGGDDNVFAHNFHSQFVNTALNFNMVLDLSPFTAYGGGVIILPWDGPEFTVSVIDPD